MENDCIVRRGWRVDESKRASCDLSAFWKIATPGLTSFKKFECLNLIWYCVIPMFSKVEYSYSCYEYHVFRCVFSHNTKLVKDHIFEGLLGGLPYAVAVRAHNLEAAVVSVVLRLFLCEAIHCFNVFQWRRTSMNWKRPVNIQTLSFRSSRFSLAVCWWPQVPGLEWLVRTTWWHCFPARAPRARMTKSDKMHETEFVEIHFFQTIISQDKVKHGWTWLNWNTSGFDRAWGVQLQKKLQLPGCWRRQRTLCMWVSRYRAGPRCLPITCGQLLGFA